MRSFIEWLDKSTHPLVGMCVATMVVAFVMFSLFASAWLIFAGLWPLALVLWLGVPAFTLVYLYLHDKKGDTNV